MQSVVGINYGNLGQPLGLSESQVKSILQAMVEILVKLPARKLSAKLNLAVGHLTVSEEGELAFAEQGNNTNFDGISKTLTSKSMHKLAGSASQPSLAAMTT